MASAASQFTAVGIYGRSYERCGALLPHLSKCEMFQLNRQRRGGPPRSEILILTLAAIFHFWLSSTRSLWEAICQLTHALKVDRNRKFGNVQFDQWIRVKWTDLCAVQREWALRRFFIRWMRPIGIDARNETSLRMFAFDFVRLVFEIKTELNMKDCQFYKIELEINIARSTLPDRGLSKDKPILHRIPSDSSLTNLPSCG